MLEIERVSWQNFGSFGDYVSEINLSNLGQCLIVGEVLDDSGEEFTDKRKSNGAGKSTLVNVIQWVLFGRTMHTPNPGDAVINWHTGKDCFGKIEFKNGDSIVRTRNVDGKNEILYYKDGDETTLTSNTLATSKIQQAQLAKVFKLDWELFCGSVFFSQYNKPWLEMADSVRKKALERALHVDRLSYYAKVGKDKSEAVQAKAHSTKIIIETLERELARLEQEKAMLLNDKDSFETRQQSKITDLQNQIATETAILQKMVLPDIDTLQQSWTVIESISNKLSAIQKKRSGIADSIMQFRTKLQLLQKQKESWLAKSGTTCSQCQQVVDASHATSHANQYDVEIGSLSQRIEENQKTLNEFDEAIRKSSEVIRLKTPSLSIREANGILKQYKMQQDKIVTLENRITDIMNEPNPYDKMIENNEIGIQNCSKNLNYKLGLMSEYDHMIKHYNYVFKAYHDRTKIKSCIFRDHIPYINSRLHHYLDILGLDIKISLTESLGINSNLWGYDFESGGERKRTDVAMMLAMFDFHDMMYGRQANFIVLDEVDGRLDDDGVEALINIIKNELSHKVESILVISHKTNMFDVFPRQITVQRSNRLSRIAEIL